MLKAAADAQRGTDYLLQLASDPDRIGTNDRIDRRDSALTLAAEVRGTQLFAPFAADG